jgi:hypothetical protein
MCIACFEPATESRPAATAIDIDDIDPATVRAIRRRHYERDLADGTLRECECGTVYRPAEDGANVWRDRCISCESRWLEDEIVRPLIRRLGRRGTRKALRRLARGE